MNHLSFLKMSRVSLIGRRIMAEYRDEYGNLMLRYDEYGNPIPLVDEYGNPIPEQIPQSQTTTVPAAGVAVGQTEKEQHHRRSDSSSSSSSSEDDEQGGRRKKKSLKEKIKEKLPGGHKSEEHAHGEGGTATSTTTTTHHEGEREREGEGEGEGQGEGHHEKKGIMEKIKERLPGHH